MPENRKYFVNRSVHLITARTEEGLPLVPSLILNFIIWGILARAKAMYQVKVCHFLFMANHFHMMIVVDNPEHVSAFTGYVKGETAHAINRLLGRRRKTIWAEGYDSPIILTYDDVLRYIIYIYLNPIKALLVSSIDEYPGVSSWSMFISGNLTKKCKHTRRDDIKVLPLPALSINEQKQLVDKYDNLSQSNNTFTLEPFAWMDCFPALAGVDKEKHQAQIISNLRAEEKKLLEQRKQTKSQPLGATTLRRQSMIKEYSPRKFGRKMICLAFDKDLRKDFISHFRYLCQLARKAYEAWKRGDLQHKIPPGLFAPALPTLVVSLPLIL